MDDDEHCHVTVVGTRRRVDLRVPAHASIAEYAPRLLQMCGQDSLDDVLPPAWSLALPGARPFAPDATLAESGVADGATLYLRDAAAGESDEAVVTDLEELVEEANQAGVTWNAHRSAYVTATLAVAVLIAGFFRLVVALPGNFLVEASAFATACALAVFGWHVTRKGWALPLALRLTIVLAAVPLMTLSCAAMPAARDTPHSLLVAVSLGAVLGAVTSRLALGHVTTLTVLVVLCIALPVTVALVLVNATLDEAAAVVAVVVLGMVSTAPTISGHLAALSEPQPNVGAGAAVTTEGDIPVLVWRGRCVLAALNTLGAVLAIVCSVVLATSGDAFALSLAACLGLVLMLRADQVKSPAAVVPLMVSGAVGPVTVVLWAPGHYGAPVWVGPLTMLLTAVVFFGVGLARAFRRDSEASPPVWTTTLATVLAMACVPLAVGVFGVLTSMWHAGQSL